MAAEKLSKKDKSKKDKKKSSKSKNQDGQPSVVEKAESVAAVADNKSSKKKRKADQLGDKGQIESESKVSAHRSRNPARFVQRDKLCDCDVWCKLDV
jgi:hypothetical protein